MKIFFFLLLLVLQIYAQPKWKRTEKISKAKITLFHGTQTANFPTTESLGKGNWMYEISHRFTVPIKNGFDALWGFDGPAKIKFAVGYGISDNLMINFGRSNLTDNYDLQLKQKIYEFNNKKFPTAISVLGGIAWNSEIPNNIVRNKLAADNFQFYSMLIFNTMLFNKKVGFGLIPSYVYNSFIYAVQKQYTFSIGTYFHYYINRMWSVWIEHNAIITGYHGKIRLDESGRSYNTVSFGASLETGGHIFNFVITNNSRLNYSQFLIGANNSAQNNFWKLGFGIIRYF